MSKHVLSAIFIATAFAVAMSFSCRNSMGDIHALQLLDSLPVESVSGVILTYTDSGVLKARLQTPRMDRFEGEKSYMEMPSGLHVDFYDRYGNVISWLDAGYAIRYEDDEVFEARDSVVVINERGDRLDTDKLLWNRREKTIFTDKQVTITTPTEILIGEGMEADETFDKWKILNPTGSFLLEEDPDTMAAEDIPPRDERLNP